MITMIAPNRLRKLYNGPSDQDLIRSEMRKLDNIHEPIGIGIEPGTFDIILMWKD